ncbi:hypothetical protein BGZ49_000658, partial [Haplosporangium sp. Z 27]
SKKDRKVPESMSGRIAQVFRKQLSGWNSGAENDLDSVPLQSGSQDYGRLSGRYNTVVNMSTVDAAAMVATGSTKGNRSNTIPQNRNYESKYSMEGPSDFYFSDQGAPGTLSLRPLAPIGEGGDEDDAEEQVSELIRLIDLRIDERMWSLEKTLARYYLDGFRLRNYSRHNSGNQYDDGKDIEAGMNPFDDSRGMTNVNKQNATSVPEPPKSPTSPAYPPRPKLNHQYEVIDELGVSQASSTAGPIEMTATRVPYPNNGEISETASSNSISPTNTLLPPGFPQRRDMRGTIRRAVERLQNEWPHSNLPEPYVPRTHYRSLDNNNNGGSTAGIPPNPYATDGRPSEPPTCLCQRCWINVSAVKDQESNSVFDAKYEGPFKVVRRTTRGAYVLRDAMDQLLKKNYSPEQLKPVDRESSDPDSDSSYEVESILDHRLSAEGDWVYTVKWKGYDDSHSDEIPYDSFDSKAIIHDYHKKLKRQNPYKLAKNAKRKQTDKPESNKRQKRVRIQKGSK